MGTRLNAGNLGARPSPRYSHDDDKYNIKLHSKAHAESLDAEDPLRRFRAEFLIPSKSDLKRKTLAATGDDSSSDQCIYLCGNSLGVQPVTVRKYVDQYLRTWATKGVMGHFFPHEDQLLPPFVDIDAAGSALMAPIVGALASEVAVMGTLTANLHFLMASFYRPTKEKYKIIIEGKAFPSDHFAVESQIRHHAFDPAAAMVLIEPEDPTQPNLSTEQILQAIDDNASETALVLLPAIQYYTGQYFDMQKITSHAHSKGLLIGWDCAHAAGNVDMQLHNWDVDFAAWCSYKYLNSGPGGMAGIFVHERHGQVHTAPADSEQPEFRPRLAGWWGGDKQTRFQMENRFVPQPGAAGFQLSNPSVIDMTAVIASLDIFNQTSMRQLRHKSLQLTGYLEQLLLSYPLDDPELPLGARPFTIITPSDPAQRGAQLSLRLEPGLLSIVQEQLEASGVVVDERKPDVIRVAPAPLYNSYSDVWEFCQIFFKACKTAVIAARP